MPDNLDLGREQLEQLELGELRSMCIERRIPIAGGAHGNTCVEKLLAWKQHPARDFPWNLKGLGQVSLEQLELGGLRSMCTERRIPVADGAHRKTCIDKLLTWKQHPARDFPWNLKGLGQDKLEQLGLNELRARCVPSDAFLSRARRTGRRASIGCWLGRMLRSHLRQIWRRPPSYPASTSPGNGARS